MAADETPQWSTEEGLLLRHEAFVAEVLKKRLSLNDTARPKPAWQWFLESSGGTALVTVIFGGIIAGVINSLVQGKLKEREVALAYYQEHLKQQQDIGTRIIELVAKCIGTSDDLISLTEKDFDPDRFRKEQQEKIIAQRTEIRRKYNDVDTEWQAEGPTLSFLIGLHSYGQEGLTLEWRNLEDSVSAYKQCAEDWYYDHDRQKQFVEPKVERTACKKEKDLLSDEMDKFSKQLAQAWSIQTSGGAEPP